MGLFFIMIKKNHKFGFLEVGQSENIYFISDTHFDHKNIINLAKRPFSSIEEMNKTLMDNWNNTVKEENSLVFILGDFCWTANAFRWENLLDRLKGDKVLIKGNHDNYKVVEKMEHKFITVRDRLEVRVGKIRLLLDHYPSTSWSGSFHGVKQIFGHIHEKDFEGASPNQYNVCVERNSYRPISFHELMSLLELQKKNEQTNLKLLDI
ncbi:MAG: metallophosphoesterase [Endomicrobiia bacterium]|nr:MAG: metallophosphoesterase [Endomicrobiia bacterium]